MGGTFGGRDPWINQCTRTRLPPIAGELFQWWGRLVEYGDIAEQVGQSEAGSLHKPGCHLLYEVTAGQGIRNQEWGLGWSWTGLMT